MSKHTPGPWFHKTDFGQVGSIELADGSVVAQAQPLLPLDHAQRNANARLIAAAPELLAALQSYAAAQQMPKYGDDSGFVWPKSGMRKPGETAWGWICEKHGLGYQSGCVCCRDDFKRHSDQKDREARHARDTALVAAEEQGRAAIAKATGESA